MINRFTEVNIGKIELWLHPFKGAFAPEYETLFVADTHFGKDTTFRRHGIPVPTGSTEETIRRVTELIEASNAKRVVILGDMFHARSSLSAAVVARLDRFFSQTADIEFQLVRGNHDAGLRSLPWPIEIVEPGVHLGRLALFHHPTRTTGGAELALCGHLHPGFKLGRPTAAKLPCFWLSRRCLVLPAIGAFTGHFFVQPKPKDSLWLIAGDEIIEHVHRGVST